ncbi:hypothetical protein [Oceanobacillus sp. CAU 1775]
MLVLFTFLLVACGDTNEVDVQDEVESTVSFRSMDIQVEDNTFTLVGEVNTDEDEFYYEIKQGEEVITEETAVEVVKEESRWVSFEISEEIPEDAFDGEDAPIITLYGKNESGEVVNPNYIPVDIGIR